jgi:hypothetical protein
MSTLIVEGPIYYSSGDEAAFFSWLKSIPAVRSVAGRLRNLHIDLKSDHLSDEELSEFKALFGRYNIDVACLSDFSRRA